MKTVGFYIVRWMGSPWHAISARNGACSMLYCALIAGKEGELIKWGCGSDRWGNERLIGTTLEGQLSVFEEESVAAFELVEKLYEEWTSRLGVE